MSDEHEGIDTLRRAIDDLADRLPERHPRRRTWAVSWAAVAAGVIVAAAIATYRFLPRPVSPASLGVEVKFLRVRGLDVEVRVFEAARAGTVVIAPAIDRRDMQRPVGVLVGSEGGLR